MTTEGTKLSGKFAFVTEFWPDQLCWNNHHCKRIGVFFKKTDGQISTGKNGNG